MSALCFFFKQKTAYEMRISDWSSDVCSSDLVAIVVQAHRDDRAALRQHALGQIRRALGDQPQRDAVFAAFLGDPAEDAADRGFLGIGAARDVAVRLFADEQDRALRFVAGSEEHTSAPPALMRSSYAVF